MTGPGPDRLAVALAGDVMLGRGVNETIRIRGFAHPWGNILPAIKEGDAFLANLECALTSHTKHWTNGEEKAFYFRADPRVVRTLQIVGLDFVSLANNHAGDFEEEGLLQTVALLDHAGIAHAGAGRSLADARRPAIIQAGGYRIAVIAFADYPVAWAAAPWRSGINYTKISTDAEHFAKVKDSLAAARKAADLVIFHDPLGAQPGLAADHWVQGVRSRGDRRRSRRLLGHSAHVVQGIEVRSGRPILYDTGDFVDDYAVDPCLRNDLSALFRLHLRPPVIESVELIPVKISDVQVNLARGAEREWFMERFGGLCAEMKTQVRTADSRLMIDLQASQSLMKQAEIA
jgi:poly-gamma-glutamate synthesis protein (capsule biosynthesis protein)